MGRVPAPLESGVRLASGAPAGRRSDREAGHEVFSLRSLHLRRTVNRYKLLKPHSTILLDSCFASILTPPNPRSQSLSLMKCLA